MPRILEFICQALSGAMYLLLATASVAYASSQNQQLRARIVNRAHAVSPTAQVVVGSLHGLRSMTPCPTRPRLRFYGSGANRDLRVSCPAKGWQLYVSIRLLRREKILVAAQDLPANTRLNRSDLSARSVENNGYSLGIASDPSAILGRRLVAPVGAGQPIYLDDVLHRVLVHSGQTVTVQIEEGLVRIRASAVAMQDGVAGQSILVKNPSTGTPYRVEVTRHGVVDNLSGYP